ncbi:M28 family peptidase [Actinomadura barringtoniae]|uniref:M28 family peptidase n=1 Tax=Actinomadura barringtoniae TaxID=1427535 RepID=A0A939TED4_9ACTN|nr:M28 family peptidase [Actinomadura barringtoniae]MBO2453235.1 M28 family peptidase [Actinomadura barringtoniae]
MSHHRWMLRPFTVLAAGAALVTMVITAPAGAAPAPAGAGQGPSSAGCANRVNDTPRKLIECIQTEDLWRHMRAFQAIADAHPGADGHPSRNSGEPGYKASVDYVAKLMRQAGYDVKIQNYKFFYFAFTALPTFREASPTPHDYTVATDWNPGQSTGAASAALQPAGGIVIPPTSSPSSTSGCAAADFTGFTAGRVALVQRGGCNYGVKVQNAQAAGATGVIVFNEGNPGRTDLINGSLIDAAGNRIVPTIPVAFTSFATGSDLLTQYDQAVQNGTAPPVMSLEIKAKVNPNADDYNVIADSKGGDPNHTVVVDAHLDAIYGAGMLDNASGSATILNIAQLMRKVKPRNKLRFIWFGGEELGELGSAFYVNNLAPADLAKIGYDLDADVTATPNYVVGVLDPAGVDLFTRTVSTQFPPQVYEPSKVARDLGIQYFSSIGKNHILFSPVGTDAEQFNQAGVPASGVLTGQDCCKLQSDVDLFGGVTGNFEGKIPSTDGGCVDNPFRWCDNLANNDKKVLTFMSRGFANMVVNMAFDTKVLSAAANPRVHAQARPSPHTTGAPSR